MKISSFLRIAAVAALALIIQAASCQRDSERRMPQKDTTQQGTTQQGTTQQQEISIPDEGSSASSARDASIFEQPGPYTVKELEFPDLTDTSRNNRNVPLKVHFPASGNNFPLAVISHGAGVGWDDNYYQAQHLASYGYVVICPEHVYSDKERIKYWTSPAGGNLKYMQAIYRVTTDPQAILGRPKDISFAIDQAERWNKEHPTLKGKINTDKVAVMGHSFGAYATLVVCGARPIVDYLNPPVGSGKGLYQGNLSDPRVDLGIAFSPQSPGSVYFGRDSYKTIDRPLVCFSGSKDGQQKAGGGHLPAESRYEAFKLFPPGDKYFLWLANADHASFSKRPGRQMRSAARSDVIEITKTMMVIFCNYYLKREQTALQYMNQRAVDSLRGKTVTSIRWEQR